jgi:hypothetical protein
MTSTSTMTAATLATPPFSRRRFAIAAAVAVVVNFHLSLIGTDAGASMIINFPIRTEITVGIVIFATALALAVAGLATWFISRRVPSFRARIAWIGALVVILSAAAPLLASADVPTGIFLAGMHVTAALAWFIALRVGRKATSAR